MNHLAVIEDDPTLCKDLVAYLTFRGYRVEGFLSAEAFYPIAANEHFDLVILDIVLPGDSGIEVARWMRARQHRTGILMLTCLSTPEDWIVGLEAGGDAYLPKNSALSVIDASCRSILRRVNLDDGSKPNTSNASRVWRLNALACILHSPDGRQICLTHAETVFMFALLSTPGAQVSRERLLSCLGKPVTISSLRNLDSLARRVRVKVSDQCGCNLPVKACYGSGYLFSAEGICIDLPAPSDRQI